MVASMEAWSRLMVEILLIGLPCSWRRFYAEYAAVAPAPFLVNFSISVVRGDTIIAALVLMVACGFQLQQAMAWANNPQGLVVTKFSNFSLT